MELQNTRRAEHSNKIQDLEDLVDEADERARSECQHMNAQINLYTEVLGELYKVEPIDTHVAISIKEETFSELTPDITYDRLVDDRGNALEVGWPIGEVFEQYIVDEQQFETVLEIAREQQEEAYTNLWETISDKVHEEDDAIGAVVYVAYPDSKMLKRASIDFETGEITDPVESDISKRKGFSISVRDALLCDGEMSQSDVYFVSARSSRLSGADALNFTLRKAKKDHDDYAAKREAEQKHDDRNHYTHPDVIDWTEIPEMPKVGCLSETEVPVARIANQYNFVDLSRFPLIDKENVVSDCIVCDDEDECPKLNKATMFYNQDKDKMN
ncbi:hypothetical protein ACFL3V_05715 [Nanoarchaeota archaeon]